MSFGWKTSNRAEIADLGIGFEFGEPVEPLTRGWHISPLVVISTPIGGAPGLSGASWCVVCPNGGAADPACCRHKEYVALEKAKRDAREQFYVRAPAKRPGLIRRFLNRKTA